MSRAIIFAAVMISAAILINGYLERAAPVRPRPAASKEVAHADGKTIAVLPFANLSEEKAGSFFAEGVREEIVSLLARNLELKVIDAATSESERAGTRPARPPGEMSGAADLLKGSVERVANRVRVRAQLIDAARDQTIWSEIYDRELTDVLALEREIAETIARQVKSPLALAESEVVAGASTR